MAKRVRNGRTAALLSMLGTGMLLANCTTNFRLSGGNEGGSGGMTGSHGGSGGMTVSQGGSSTGGSGGGTTSTTSSSTTSSDDGGTLPVCEDAGAWDGGALVWAKRFPADDNQQARAIAQGLSGHFVIAGTSSLFVDLGTGPLFQAYQGGAFVAESDGDGAPVWASGIVSQQGADTERMGLAVGDNGEVFVSGLAYNVQDAGLTIPNGGFVARFDPGGMLKWVASPKGTDAYVLAASGGDVLVAGSFVASMDPGGLCGTLTSATSAGDTFVLKLDGSTGACVWSMQLGATGGSNGRGIAVDGLGNAFIAGDFTGTINNCPGTPASAGGSVDAFVAKIAPDGQCQWARGFGDGDEQVAAAVTLAGADVVVAGNFRGSVSFDDGGTQLSTADTGVFLASLAQSDGHAGWKYKIEPGDALSPGSHAKALAVFSDGSGVFVTGSYTPNGTLPDASDKTRDAFVEAHDMAGGLLWRDTITGMEPQMGYGVTSDGCGVLVAGGMGGVPVLNNQPIPFVDVGNGAGSREVVILRLAR